MAGVGIASLVFAVVVFGAFVEALFTLAVEAVLVVTLFRAVAGSFIGWAITLVAADVGLVVQYHVPFANAHAWPSGAES